MKAIEIRYTAQMNELNKLNIRLEKAEKALEKKRAAAVKYGVADMDPEAYRAWIATVETTELGWIVNKADIKKNGAYHDLCMAEDNVEEIREQIERAEKRFEKVTEQVNKYYEEVEAINDLKEKEALRKLEFEQEQKEWKKDGITLLDRYSGLTPSGKRFSIYGNSGWTERSRHCFTLYVDGNMIFTSGEFWRAYGIVKNS